tara:strand:+ start:3249 stop:4346 length:1098 start_codon:yes stop_codon:yes gene_type:complete
MKKSSKLNLVSVIIAIVLLGCKESKIVENNGISETENMFMNPLLDSGADPWTIYHEGNYYYIKSEGKGITLLRTPDITDLRNAESKVIWTAPETGDHSKNVWAPEIHNIGDKWYVYIAADDGDNRNHRMFVLENSSANPFEGIFTLKSKLKTDSNDNWAIDGSIFEHKDSLYFIWSGWEKPKELSETQNIYIARMSNPWTISSERVLLSSPELEWEKKWNYPDAWTPDAPVYVNEGPQMLAHGNKIHIIYSASGCWTPYYALGILTANINNNLMDKASWTKGNQPIFKQSEENKVYGTGHNSFFKSPDGKEDWVLYHANDNPVDGCGNKRSPRAQKMGWDKNDMPVLGVALPTTVKLIKPSGILK